MRTIGNILWLLLAGLELAIAYVLAGLVACLLIVTIPFGLACFRLAFYVIWPFGRTVVDRPTAGVGSALGNVLWLVLLGWWLALAHLITGVILLFTIIGIPLAIANFKMVPLALLPLGREIVTVEMVEMRRYGF